VTLRTPAGDLEDAHLGLCEEIKQLEYLQILCRLKMCAVISCNRLREKEKVTGKVKADALSGSIRGHN
jgi:hypothetical protein